MLTEREKLFGELAEYIFQELGGLIKQFKTVDDARRDLFQSIKILKKEKSDMTLDDLIRFMFDTKEERVGAGKRILEKMKKDKEWQGLQSAFSKLRDLRDITDTAGGRTSVSGAGTEIN